PRLAHPAPSQARHRQALRLRLSGQEGPGGRHGQGKDDLPAEHEPAARSPAASAEPDVAGLDRVLQVRMLERDLQLPEVLSLEGDHQMAETQASAHPLEATTPTLRHLAHRWRCRAVRSGQGQREALLLPGNPHPDTMAEHSMSQTTRPPGACGEPGALCGARRVREAAQGNPPAATLAGRPGPTSRLASPSWPATPIVARSSGSVCVGTAAAATAADAQAGQSGHVSRLSPSPGSSEVAVPEPARPPSSTKQTRELITDSRARIPGGDIGEYMAKSSVWDVS